MRHDYYRELSALALSGQLSLEERQAFEQHLVTCEKCRAEFGDFAQLVSGLRSHADQHTTIELPAGTTQRFLARARSEGIPLGRKVERPSVLPSVRRRNTISIAIAAMLVFACANYVVWRSRSAGPAATLNIQALPPKPQTLSTPFQDELVRENAELKARVQSIQAQLNVSAAKLKIDEGQLKADETDKKLLNVRVAKAESSSDAVRQGLSDREREIAQLKSKLQELNSEKKADAVAFQLQEAGLTNLRQQIAKLELDLREAQELSDAANEAKDLIHARNLHIVDVNDTDANGRRERPFGRIFYAEGQSLKFYAYDLNDPRKLNTKINFYVWGSKEGAAKSVKSLGIFHSDDVTDRRWVLDFKDAKVLAQIDCVFVTAESDRKPVTQPTGRQILFASLGRTPNHP